MRLCIVSILPILDITGYFDDLKEGKPNPFWNSSWGPKPTDSDYQHKGMLKRLGFNPEDFADD